MAAPSSSATVLLGEARRHKGVVALAVGALALLMVGAGFGVYHWSAPRRSGFNLQNMTVSKLTQSGKAAGVSLSPDGRYVVYVLREGEKQSLWVRQVATRSDVQVLAPDVVSFYGLAFSPDGNYIYFIRSDKSTFSYSYLYQMPVLGGPPRLLIRDVDATPSFSPDGKRLAYVRGVPAAGGLKILQANSDGSAERELASWKRVITFDTLVGPAWSPDGKTVAVSSLDSSAGNKGLLSLISVADGETRDLYSSPGRLGKPVWLPDGRGLLVAVSDPSQAGRSQLWQITYPGGEARRFTNDLTDYDRRNLDLTADGKTLATVENNTVSDIWVNSGETASTAQQITSGEPMRQALWIPGGKVAAVSASGQLWLMDADGNHRTLLTPGENQNVLPSPCGDQGSIVFTSGRQGAVDIWKIDADGSNPT
ncbi:MAG: TolB family protein, partial [Burkholderiales bacterium]